MFLDDLTLFLRIVEKGGMAAAGRDLGLSRATVSERLAALEQYYGTRLLTRTTRALHLTDEGRALVDGARRILAEAGETHDRIRKGAETLAGMVRVSASSDMGRNRISTVIDMFLEQHPSVSVDLTFSDGYVDLVGHGIDIAVRLGTLPDSSMRARLVARNRRIVCAAPAYLDRRGRPQRPEDLTEHDCITMRFGREADNRWTFVVDGQAMSVMVSGQRIANDGGYVRSAAIAGYGIALKSIWDVADDLASGRLVRLLAPFTPPPTGIHLVYPQGAIQPRRVRALMDHLAGWFAANQPDVE